MVGPNDEPLVKLSPQELCEQPAGEEYQRNPAKETEAYFGRASRVIDWIERYPSASARLRELVVRCPDRGCQLAEVYRFDLPPRPDPWGTITRGQRYVAVTSLRSGKVGGGFCNWAFSDGWAGAAHWFPAGCPHGTAKLNRHWLVDCVGAIHVWKHAFDTEENFLSKLPEEQAKGRARRVFHPPDDMWTPRGRR